MKNRIILAVLIILWMIIVFCFSNQDSQESSNISEKIVDINTKIYNNEKINEEKLETIIRKGAHMVIYTIGGILFFLFFNTYEMELKNRMIYAMLIGILYAITDEIHQGFIPGRTPKITDILIDTIGVGIRNNTKLLWIKIKQKNIKALTKYKIWIKDYFRQYVLKKRVSYAIILRECFAKKYRKLWFKSDFMEDI